MRETDNKICAQRKLQSSLEKWPLKNSAKLHVTKWNPVLTVTEYLIGDFSLRTT